MGSQEPMHLVTCETADICHLVGFACGKLARCLHRCEVLATAGVAKLLAFAAMNPNMLLEVAARHRHLEPDNSTIECIAFAPLELVFVEYALIAGDAN